MASRISASVGLGFSSRKGTSVIRKPGVQKPHCRPCASRKASCRGWRWSMEPSPSTVCRLCPSACTANIRQERTGCPSKRMVQVPQTPCSQPTWVPVRPSSWRRKSLRSMRGSTVRVYSAPLTVRVMVNWSFMRSLLWRVGRRFAGCGGRGLPPGGGESLPRRGCHCPARCRRWRRCGRRRESLPG